MDTSKKPAVAVPAFRSRRKRRRPNNISPSSIALASQERDESDRCSPPVSLPLLLRLRETGIWTKTVRSWQNRMLRQEGHSTRAEWRPYAKREIPFSSLDTPQSEAVLALETKGSYMLSLGGRVQQGETSLTLQFYGVPGRSRLATSCSTSNETPICPMIHQVSLWKGRLSDQADNVESDTSPVASMQVEMLISNQWDFGMAFIRQSPMQESDHVLGSIVLFSPPGMSANLSTKTVQCRNVYCRQLERVGCFESLLWPVQCIPSFSKSDGHDRFESTTKTPGYLCFNDEDDGYRLTWVKGKDKCDEPKECRAIVPTLEIRPSRNDIITFPEESSWEEESHNSTEDSPQWEVAIEAYLHMDALFEDIKARRPKIFKPGHLPHYSYSLVSVDNGRNVVVVLAFLKGARDGKLRGLAVTLCVDIFTQFYKEEKWLEFDYKSTKSLKDICDSHAIRCRREKLDDRMIITSHSELYPQCTRVTNMNVRYRIPVSNIRGRDSPLELVYG